MSGRASRQRLLRAGLFAIALSLRFTHIAGIELSDAVATIAGLNAIPPQHLLPVGNAASLPRSVFEATSGFANDAS
ncbi:hypothetical protein B0H17DRAFT_1212704 [Mycena rosella]|uniref:Uncharacterized protein n=1 Tax=Mycena rosella TaxID=1033263 RepID=A0AAD7CRI3_MYCRO|nr:hypothetical protein B0H17DRAFT_1212704 [Mycena rosella]